MNEQEQFWAGADGDAYTQRNRYDWRLRIPFWTKIIERTGARSAYEFGCNVGYNLSAIRRAFPDVEVGGEDLNWKAIQVAIYAGLRDAYVSRDGMRNEPRELAFTVGVLIHIAPENLRAFMQRVVDASSDYVLAVEYATRDDANLEEAIEYRGKEGFLWRRNCRKLYEQMGLVFVEGGFLSRPAFDDCTFALMRKP